jgi:hypothetical protein
MKSALVDVSDFVFSALAIATVNSSVIMPIIPVYFIRFDKDISYYGGR